MNSMAPWPPCLSLFNDLARYSYVYKRTHVLKHGNWRKLRWCAWKYQSSPVISDIPVAILCAICHDKLMFKSSASALSCMYKVRSLELKQTNLGIQSDYFQLGWLVAWIFDSSLPKKNGTQTPVRCFRYLLQLVICKVTRYNMRSAH